MIPEIDPFWFVAYWVVIGLATIVCVIAAIVIAHDFFAAPPDPPRTEIRNRLRVLPK